MERKEYQKLFEDLQCQIDDLHLTRQKIRDIDPSDPECKNIGKRIWGLILQQAEVVKHLWNSLKILGYVGSVKKNVKKKLIGIRSATING